MIVKSKAHSDHPADLRETLSTLRKYRMMLNPKKCVFGVKGGKCLGFLVDERGIEANPDKIKAVLEMKSPRNVREVQRLTGCLAALGRFLSRSADKSLFFFKALKRKEFTWDEEAEQAFTSLKLDLSTLPKLMSPLPGETLFIYLAVSKYTLSAMLVAERERTQHPIYFISHAFRGAEAKYNEVEKMVFALVMASRKLKPYFQAHQIKVLTGQLLPKVIESRNHSSRMTDWADQLADFGLEYEPRRAIKAQALADFTTECTTRPPVGQREEWELYVDGSSTKSGCGAGLVLKPPIGEKMEYEIKFEFLGSNNEAEYEALILGLQLCILAGATAIEARSDSQLIVGRVSGEYEAKEDNMRMYLAKAQEFIKKLSHFHISHIPRSENQQVDALARMASSAEGSAPRTIMWEVLRQPSINAKEQLILDRTSTWMDEVVGYLREGILPADAKEAERIKHRAGWFLWHDEQLYKKSYTHPLLKCVTPEEGNYILREIHQGASGSHQGGRTIAGKALRAGYYWPTLKADAQELVNRCPSCQIHSDIPRAPATPLTSIQAVLPFDKWSMDLLGPFPPASG
ncbi:uncharacterized protein LOC104882874 [Beta vulgaris subsp. vulgaris]|uniref:uncharacterized protein LOC104882874 n=1 Tax=Beta vulgaris subsp. vulgaris TaxID=3555 RepID=UPI0020366A25|nr:uncharacterized protein LOC104882874 [Beta vulgaris subsp. vulgaris]